MVMINKDTNKHFILVLCVEYSFYMHRIVSSDDEHGVLEICRELKKYK